MKVAAYLRCSTRKQDLDGQRRAVATWAAREGHEVVSFEDDHVSGRRADRDGIERLLKAADAGELSLVAVTELSRIGRSLSFVYSAVERLAAKSVKIVLVSSGTTIDATTLEGRALLGALALAADIEWALIAERNARGRATIRERGVRVGRKPVELSEAALRALRSQGLSVREIAAELRTSPATVGRRLQAIEGRQRAAQDPTPPASSAP